jgi:hypothetical protein
MSELDQLRSEAEYWKQRCQDMESYWAMRFNHEVERNKLIKDELMRVVTLRECLVKTIRLEEAPHA